MSATVPLLLEKNIELGSPPSYKEAVDVEWTLQDRSLQRHWFFDFNFAKATANFTPVVFASVAIRLDNFQDFYEKYLVYYLCSYSLQLYFYGIVCNVGNSSFSATTVVDCICFTHRLIHFTFRNVYSRPFSTSQLHIIGVLDYHAIHYFSFFDVKIVIEAVGLTALTVIGLFFYTLQSKRDFQSHWAALFSISMIFLAAIFVHLLIPSVLFDFLLAAFGAVLFSIYLVFDIDRIMHHTSPEDYIEACVSLYLEIINLFLRILEILNETNRN
ncbi:Uncharacterized protein BM_BM1852 [Brugia malayi]|uniref:BMA-TMBI-4 n=1 Tax=Brugia malayi TaxID=6279 RepID=A0A0I9N4X6_BRUMA|nr:Uncharacterized protein BM_BM1852 [Brugia malayi]CTP81030.1 BMA-TMBI-4 [Brugia malayi]VIO88666.1 Uncharacterized protein BM_BM1852 [Brugia malayi]